MAVGDREFLRVLSLYGAEGVEVTSPQGLVTVLRELLQRKDLVLILLERECAEDVQEEVRRLKLEAPIPLVIELDKHPALREAARYLTNNVSKR